MLKQDKLVVTMLIQQTMLGKQLWVYDWSYTYKSGQLLSNMVIITYYGHSNFLDFLLNFFFTSGHFQWFYGQ